MEAVAGVSIGVVPGRVCRGETVYLSKPENCVSFLGKAGKLRSVHSFTTFQDQGHVQFYSSVECGRTHRQAKLVRLPASSAVCESHESVGQSKALLKMKKMQKKKKKAKAGESSSSSSSSSSSESNASNIKQMSRRRSSMDQLRREWESIARSPLMNSIPTFSSDFSVIEGPEADPSGQVVALDASSIEGFPDTRDPRGPVSSSMPSAVPNANVETRVPATRSSKLGDASESISNAVRTCGGLAVPNYISEASATFLVEPATARVEVCMGGKCRKAGAQEILSTFHSNGVPASACNKCMKNCRLAVNVRVQSDDTNLQMYSGVTIRDVDALSQKHFAVGSPPSGSSSFTGEALDFRHGANSLVH